MRRLWQRFLLVGIGASLGALLVATTSFAQGGPDVRSGPADPVVIVGPNPVPIEGEVSATLDQPVVVEAGAGGLAVDVASLEAKLDELTAAVEASAQAQPGGPVATYCRVISEGGDGALYCFLADPADGIASVPPDGPPDAPTEVLIQSITINAVDEEVDISLWKDGERVTVVANSFEDSINGPVFHMTYPVPIEADLITINCNNEFETCNVLVSWVGRLSS